MSDHATTRTSVEHASRSGEGAWIRASTIGATVVFMTALTAALANVTVNLPGAPVPFTMQPMIVLLSGLVLGPRLGLISQVLYLAAGIVGLPVFAASSTLPQGAARLLGPTGGYLMAYPLASLVVGVIAARGQLGRRYVGRLLAVLAGTAVIFSGGVLWLTAYVPFGADYHLGLRRALSAGLYPFIVGDVLKCCLAAWLAPQMRWIRAHASGPLAGDGG